MLPRTSRGTRILQRGLEALHCVLPSEYDWREGEGGKRGWKEREGGGKME